ncbi:MAG TPA: hypothetical protein VGC13_24485 [Longimicrobium sp.]|jgi:hypothetical protein|uniref:hypothetical protein n=1 Tax=Longimicrobium sp. TaxID=2029185 RepID=UPI002EDA00A9
MRKLALHLDALLVESFELGGLAGTHGTVHGHDSRITEWCNSRSCPYGCTILEADVPAPLAAAEPRHSAE